MRQNSANSPRVLVVIANYGHAHDEYLCRLVQEYQSMSFATDIVVCSNVEKPVPTGVEIVVGLPNRNPWSLPFAHKKIFAERIDDYDLFIYSEDDTLITERNILAFVEASALVREDEVPGFLRFERGRNGQRNYPEVHGHFHWDCESLCSRGGELFAYFTCEHSACYVVTREQLRRAIKSGGFLVPPHEGIYDLACTAATDPYVQCGYRKLICISKIEDFLVHHLPNRYVGTTFGVNDETFQRQIDVLLQIGRSGQSEVPLFEAEVRLPGGVYSKNFYEPVRPLIFEVIPKDVQSVLSVGCGHGATEAYLADKGLQVVAVPMDPVIVSTELAEKCEVLCGDMRSVRHRLSDRRFDCLLLVNTLHLLDDPGSLLAAFGELLAGPRAVVILTPNMLEVGVLWGWITRKGTLRQLGNYEESGVHWSSAKAVRSWCEQAGVTVTKIINRVPERRLRTSKATYGTIDSILSSELIIAGEKKTQKGRDVGRPVPNDDLVKSCHKN